MNIVSNARPSTARLRSRGRSPRNARLVFIVITTRQRNTALLVAGCLFMDMLDGTNMP